jgi:hypothetical protein
LRAQIDGLKCADPNAAFGRCGNVSEQAGLNLREQAVHQERKELYPDQHLAALADSSDMEDNLNVLDRYLPTPVVKTHIRAVLLNALPTHEAQVAGISTTKTRHVIQISASLEMACNNTNAG